MNKETINLAPVVLFVYNRPEHTRRTLEALTANALADKSVLYVYLDGPRDTRKEEDIEAINAIEALVTSRKWCKELHLIKRTENWGLAKSIESGVTEVLEKHDRIVVLEDDIVTSPGFLQYMNDALELYQSDRNVMHISGYMFPIKKKLPSTFFYNTASCWGWGTWKSAWTHYSNNPLLLLRKLHEAGKLEEFNLWGKGDFLRQLLSNVEGRKTSWAVKWYASFFLENGAALHPYPSLTTNIGFDGTGEHGVLGENHRYGWKELAESISVSPLKEYDDKAIRLEVAKYLSKSRKKISITQQIKKIGIDFIPPVFRRVGGSIYRRFVPVHPDVYELEYQQLSSLTRYLPGQTRITGKLVKFPDAASFRFSWDEIFVRQIYQFKSDIKQPYIIDAGANVGLASLYFKSLYPESEIVAFEADPSIAEYLKFNIESHGYADINIQTKALWYEETVLNFAIEGSDGGRIDTDGTRDHNSLKVDAITLSPFLCKPVDFLKIDIEGAELKVLRECSEALKNVMHLFVEYHSFTNELQELDELLRILSNAGFRYTIESFPRKNFRPFVRNIELLGMDLQLNIFAWR